MTLFKFLEQEDLVEIFMRNYLNELVLTHNSKERRIFSGISSALTWHGTLEGSDYWSKVDDKYEDHYKKHKREL